MLTNRSRVVLYIGVTNSLEGRLWWHWNTEKNSFVKKYKLDRLVYYEAYDDICDAIAREKQLKRWRREEDLGTRMFGSPMRGPSTSLGMTSPSADSRTGPFHKIRETTSTLDYRR
jgi:predicted GIY-YIG superfamily endonuclease